MSNLRRVIGGWLGMFLISTGAFAAPPAAVTLGHRQFTLRTPRLEATIRDGVVVSLRNLKTGELHCDPALTDLTMPRGLMHLTGDLKALEKLHGPWGTASLNQALPAGQQTPLAHYPAPDSRYQTTPLPGGVRATWTGLTNGRQSFPAETLTIEAQVEAASGQLLLRASGSSPQGGVVGLQAPLANLHPDHAFYVPSFGGVVYDRQMAPALITLGGAPFWEAPAVGLEGRLGSLGLWVQDETFASNFCFLQWSGKSFSLAIEYLNLMPFEPHQRAESFTWRVDVGSGGWTEALTPYKEWYACTFAPEMKIRAAVKWADRIQVMVDHFDRSEEAYRLLAATFDPETVLLHDWNARAPAFDAELPDWTPRPGYVETVAAQQKYGFRTMAYVNTYCVNYNSPVFVRDRIAEFGLTRKIRGIARYTAEPQTFENSKDGQLLYLDPLSPRWRQYHTDMMIKWREETRTDANYEDVGGTAGDFGNGVIAGKSGAQGGTEQFRDLLRRNPTAPMASEYAPSDIAFAVRWPLRFQQVWGGERTRVEWMLRQRPVSAFIHGPGARAWVPLIRAESDFHRHVVVACSDALGGLGQCPGVANTLRATTGVLYHMRLRAQLFAHRQLTPHFTPQRLPREVACRYTDREGRLYTYTTTPTVQQMTGPDNQPLYQRITGLNQFATPLTLPGWPAAQEGRLLGLNPVIRYALERGAHDRTKVQVTALPEGVILTRFDTTSRRTILSLAAVEKGPEKAKVSVIAHAKMLQVLVNDQPGAAPEWSDTAKHSAETSYEVSLPAHLVFIEKAAPAARLNEPLGDGRETARYIAVATGLERGGEYVIPHRTGIATPGISPAPEFLFLNGGGDAELVLDYMTVAPKDGVLRVLVRNSQTRYGNGAIGKLYLNGRLAHQHDFGPAPNPDWKEGMDKLQKVFWETTVHEWRVPLGHLAGQPLAISIASDAKGENNADSLWWARPVWLADPAQGARFVRHTEQGEQPE